MAETVLIQLVRCYNFLFVLVDTILAKLKVRRGAGGLSLPPGPLTLPDNTHNLLGALPHQAMHRLAQQHGPVMLLRLGDVHTLVLSSAEAATEAMEVHGATFADRPKYATAGIFAYGGQHLPFAELLGPTRVRSFRSVREEEAVRLVVSIFFTMSSWGPVLVDVNEVVKDMMNAVFTRVAIGDRCLHRAAYLKELGRVMDRMSGFNLADLFPTSRLAWAVGGGLLRLRARGRIQSVVDSMIREHKTTMKSEEEADGRMEDILSTLLRFQGGNVSGVALTNENVSDIFFDIFSAGSEAAAATIIWAMSELIRSPRIMAMAQSEVRLVLHGKKVTEANIEGQLPYLQMVVKETFRLHPPVTLLHPMLCTEPSKIMGYDVSRGTTVFVNMWAIGRDEEGWTDASEFKPERFEGEKVDYFPDRAGQQMCPVTMFAVSNIEIALASLLKKFDWKLPNDGNPEELDMTEAYGISGHRRTPLLLKATRHFYWN